ncbi:MAG: PilN domain-containing protein [Holophagaceae bacterium]|jgi:Tfp pilus assembly protein PilN|uniref:PilN domain-containing protein n=1 Tax=Candidatus Geothrix odensensis TaxID=2954440 RepID=A0A936F155_9BACT|nr:PilN domain-containing protein [Holophagaceae bacterium]MBK8571675.1 PilN domain-containing protein [Candidatus Geothrix odensensis]MBK8788755.1 PilN domain-containing protein [Holophagaceae bacterium]
MIKINLLGDALAQAGAKKGGEKASAEPVQVYTGEGGSRSSLPIAGVVVGLLFSALGGGYYLWLNSEFTREEKKKAELERDKKQYEPFIALEKKFREKKDALQKKEEVMTTLKRQQALPVHFMEELANSLPDDVWFKKVSQKGMTITVEGEGRNFESINAFYGNLQSRTRWFKKINYPGAKRGTSGAFEFTISFELQNAV